ncbi:MAG: hypothetical protein Q4C96_05345 [Planctomycetia bacterium]|nr:hypothetical protein [Planctomycetia bacterium]
MPACRQTGEAEIYNVSDIKCQTENIFREWYNVCKIEENLTA